MDFLLCVKLFASRRQEKFSHIYKPELKWVKNNETRPGSRVVYINLNKKAHVIFLTQAIPEFCKFWPQSLRNSLVASPLWNEQIHLRDENRSI